MNHIYTYKPAIMTVTKREALGIELAERLTRRRFIIGVGGMLGAAALSACGAGDEAAAPTAVTSPTRMITHAMGETEVPCNPQRVVVLDTGELDSALALGVKPIGAVTALPDSGFSTYLQEQAEGITMVGTIQEPNLETVATLNPDLILSSKLRHEAIYDQLSQIAPTVFTERVGVVWKENLRLHAEALGKADEAEQMMNDYQARLADLRQAMGDRLTETEVSIVRFIPGQIRIYEKANFIGTILDDAGLPRPESQRDDVFMTEANKELISQMDGDVMFVTVYGDPADTALEDFRSDPLWQQLDVVQAGNVYEVPDDYWMLGIGILAANRVIDDLEQYLLTEASL